MDVPDNAAPQEPLDVQAFVAATDDENMSEVEAVAVFLAGRSNAELMRAAKAAATLHAPRVRMCDHQIGCFRCYRAVLAQEFHTCTIL